MKNSSNWPMAWVTSFAWCFAHAAAAGESAGAGSSTGAAGAKAVPATAAAKPAAPRRYGFRYTVPSKTQLIVYADGPVSVQQNGARKIYPRGSLLFVNGDVVSNLGIVGAKNIEAALASPDRKEIPEDIRKMAAGIDHYMMGQTAATSYSCTKNVVMTLPVLEMLGVVGTAAGMTVVAEAGISLTVPECADKP